MATASTSARTRLESEQLWKLLPHTSRLVVELGATAEAGLEKELIELVDLRCSQINGCAWCVQYHTDNLIRLGVAPEKVTLVAVWEEAGIFSEREAAALAWAEAVTLLSETRVPDSAYEAARSVFSDHELACLTTAIATINVWNRFNVAYRVPPEFA
jgi:AhpD family alkylhydroperoxidase